MGFSKCSSWALDVHPSNGNKIPILYPMFDSSHLKKLSTNNQKPCFEY